MAAAFPSSLRTLNYALASFLTVLCTMLAVYSLAT